MDYEIMMNGNVRIGMQAPEFEASTTMGDIKLSDYKGKWVVLFSCPGAFLPTCTTEMIAFANANTYFDERNATLIGLSVDSNASHLAWAYDIYMKTGIRIPFPIIADGNGVIARKYGMISPDISNTEAIRNVVIIDDKGVVRTVLEYPKSTGRFIPEIIRIIDSLQISDTEEVSTPANWFPGSLVVNIPPQTFDELIERANYLEMNNNALDWYLVFEERNKKLE